MAKVQSVEEKNQIMREKRDAKVREHLSQYAPVWMIKETMLPGEDAILFEVLFTHPLYGWTNRRYRFDSFNSVLYHEGQHPVDETKAVEIMEKDPYINASSVNTVNSYGG